MAYNNGIDGKSLLDEISKVIDAAAGQYREAGEDAGEEYIEGVIDGIKKHSKEAKSEIAKIYEDFNKTTNNFKSRKSVTQAEWTRILGLSKELMKSERYADRVREKLSDISVTLKNGTKVSGLEKVLEEWTKVGGLVESVQWAEAGKNYRKKPSTKKPKVETPVVQADPTPVVKAEEKKQEAIKNTTAAIVKQGEAIEQVAKKTINMAHAIRRYNKLMEDLGNDDSTTDRYYDSSNEGAAKKWTLKDMVNRARMHLDTYNQEGHANHDLKNESDFGRKMWESETKKLQRFINRYEPYVDLVQTTVGDVQQATTVTEKQTEALQKQASAAEGAAKAQEKLNKIQLKRVKSTSGYTDKNGSPIKYVPETYEAMDGRYRIEKGTEGWNLYDQSGRVDEFITAYETLKELREDLLLISQREAKVVESSTDVQVEALQQQASAIDTAAETINKQNQISISSYQDLYAALEKVVNLSKQLKPEYTAEYGGMYEMAYKAGYPDSKESLIASIKAQYDNVQRIKASIKNGLSVYKDIDGDGYEATYNIDNNTLKNAENMLHGYIYQAVEYFGYSVADAMNDFDKKRIRTFVEKEINKYLEVSSKNDEYRMDAEAFNAPIRDTIESITDTIINMATDAKSNERVFDSLAELKSRPEDVNRYTLSTQANHIGSNIGLSTPYSEVQENVKKIETYEELCELVARYNELQERNVTFGGTEYAGLDEAEEMELRRLRARLEATGGKGIYKLSSFRGFDNVDKLADAMGITDQKAEKAQKEIEAARLEAEQFVATCKEVINQEIFDDIDCSKLLSDLETAYAKLMQLEEEGKVVFGADDPENLFYGATHVLEYQKRVAEAAKDGIVYHAGVLGNVERTMKSRPLGSVVPVKSGEGNSLTGLYTTPDWDGFVGNEWSGAPISTIDINQYKLFDARRKSIALQAHQFFDNLNGTIYGYQEYFDNEAQEMAKTTDVKSIESLYEEFKSVFVNAEMSFEQFAAFIKESAAIVKGHDFKPIDYVDIDEGVGKSYSTSALQGVSKEIFNSDSFSTRLMKMLGYEGLDTRGSGFDSTYRGGTVIFDVKPESIISTDGKWSELMSRHGVELDEKSLEREEKRRQLAFDTAKAYSQQADAQKIDLYENTDGQLALFDGLSSSAQHAEENVEELEDAVKRVYDLDNQMNFDDLLREETKQADVSDQSARLAAIKSEKEAVKARGEQLRKESQSIIKEISSKTGYKRKGSLQEIIGLDPDHLQKAKKAYDDNEGNNKRAINTIETALELKSSNNIAKAFVQIARFPEKYGGILSKKQAQEHLSDNRLYSNAIVPLGNGRNIVFGTTRWGPIGQDQYDTHYRIYDVAPKVFDDNGNSTVGTKGEPLISFSRYKSESNKIFGMSSEQLKKLPIVQQAIQDYDKQYKEDESVIGILKSGDKFVQSIDSLVPLLTRFSDVKQEYATELEKYHSLSEEEKNIEQEIASRNAQLETKKEELTTEQQITEQKKTQADLTQEIEAQKEAPKVEEKPDDNKLFETPSGQYSLFEEVLEDSNVAKESVSELNQEIQKIEELDGQISLFDKQDEKVIDTSNIPDDFRMVSVSPESTAPQIAVHDLNDIAGMNSTEEAYDQLIEGENKYQQELEETARIKKERDGQVEAFSYAAVPFIGDDEYKAVSNDDKIKLFDSFVNKIAEDGMSASDAMDQLYMSMEALRKQSEAMPDNIGVDYSAEIQKLEAHVNNLGEEFKNSEQYRDNFNMLVDGIKSGSISAAQAMDKMSDAYEKWNIELIGSEQSDDKDLLDIVANKNDPRVAKAFKNMDIKKWIKGNVKKDAREELEGELYKLAQTLVDDNSEAYNAQLSHIAEFIVANFKSRESKEENPYNKVFEDLIVPYTDKDKAEMGEQLFEKAKRILGNKFQKRSEKNKHVDAIDQLVDSIAGSSQRSMFDDPEGYESHYNKFDEMLDKFDEWKQEGKRKTKDTYLSDSDVPGLIENFNETMRDQMVANIKEQQEILDAKTEAAQAATDNLDKAFQSVKSASSRAVLKGQTKADFEDFARQIANDSGMELGTVAVSRDEMDQMRLATIKLINKELAQSITYTYDIQENIEGVNEAFLRSTYAVGDVNKALENAKNKEAKMLQAQLSALKTEESAYGKINTNVRSIGEDNLGDGFKQKIASYESSLRDLRAAMDALKVDPVDASGNLHKAFDDAALKAKNARVEIEGIFKQSQKLDQVMANMDVFGSKNLDPSELKNLQQAMLSFASSAEDGVFKFKGFNKAGTEMYGTLEQSGGAIKNVTVALKQSSDQLFMYGTNANRADNEWEEFKNTLASGTKNLVGMYVGFQEGVQAIRSGVEAVKQIDLAMTELKKVTDETDDSYREFLEDAGRTSAVIGSTVSDFAEASATFARLGYSLDEASSMAETAIVYKNVAD